MLPHLTNMTGLWALLGVPLIVAIHFLQHRTKERLSATLFLLEALAPETRTGRVWDRLRTSRAFWLQILAVLLMAWVLAEPCWVRESASQTVVFVMDDSAGMQPFRKEAVQAVAEEMELIGKQGIPTNWVLTGSRPAQLPFYRGTDSGDALRALDQWQPSSGAHDPEAALRTAAALAGPTGLARMITNAPLRVPPGQSARGVGSPLGNTGFAGVTPIEGNTEEKGAPRWRIAVSNNTSAAVSRTVTIKTGGNRPNRTETLAINPGALAEFSLSLPDGCDQAALTLPPDEFPADDTLMLVRPAPRPVAVNIALPEEQTAIFRSIWSSLPGFSPGARRPAATLTIITEEDPLPASPPGHAIIMAARKGHHTGAYAVTAETHPLTDGLNWSGLLLPAPGTMEPGRQAAILLWRQNLPAAWLENGNLVLNWVWEDSNAARLPAPVLMIRRFMESVQRQAPGTFSDNIPGGSRLPLPGGVRLVHTTPDGEKQESAFSGRMPEQTGLADVFPAGHDAAPLFHGAIWFADAAMGDFSRCASFDTGLQPLMREARRQMRPDPLTPLWLALAGLALLGSWLPSATNRATRP